MSDSKKSLTPSERFDYFLKTKAFLADARDFNDDLKTNCVTLTDYSKGLDSALTSLSHAIRDYEESSERKELYFLLAVGHMMGVIHKLNDIHKQLDKKDSPETELLLQHWNKLAVQHEEFIARTAELLAKNKFVSESDLDTIAEFFCIIGVTLAAAGLTSPTQEKREEIVGAGLGMIATAALVDTASRVKQLTGINSAKKMTSKAGKILTERSGRGDQVEKG
jgi:hypothetical protein